MRHLFCLLLVASPIIFTLCMVWRGLSNLDSCSLPPRPVVCLENANNSRHARAAGKTQLARGAQDQTITQYPYRPHIAELKNTDRSQTQWN